MVHHAQKPPGALDPVLGRGVDSQCHGHPGIPCCSVPSMGDVNISQSDMGFWPLKI